MSRRNSSAARALGPFLATLVTLGPAACAVDPDAAGQGPASYGRVTPARGAAVTSAVADAHARHQAVGLRCDACHACAGTLAFGPVAYPGGTTTEGGTLSRVDGVATCSVACHAPLGADPRPVAWNAGPQGCTSCHSNVTVTASAPIRSSHVMGAELSSELCGACHDPARHLGGEVVSAAAIAGVTGCVDCHDGTGQTLGDRTPPLLVGWDDAAAGDFHGARPGTCRFDRLDPTGARSVGEGALACPPGQPAFPGALRVTSRWWYQSGLSGAWVWTCDLETVDAAGDRTGTPLLRQPCPAGTILNSACNDPRAQDPDCYPTTLVTRGFGGTLRAPFTREENAPLACGACHDFHASTNDFLLAAEVNGVALPPGAIDRAGVGAQHLCNACHAGDRHEVCRSCHKEIWTTDGEYSWFEGAPVDPVPDGSACFYCHGHEGIRFMIVSSPRYPGNGHPFGIGGGDGPECSHCHSAWAPPATEYVAPTFYAEPPRVSGVTATTALVSWRTAEKATSYVEYGVGTAGLVAGDDAFVTTHQVTLAGLSPGTPYVWRVRTSDAFRNVTLTALSTFTTPAADAVPWPDLAPVSVSARVGTYEAPVTLVWFPVAAPSGTAVEYEVQLASDPGFTFLVNGSLEGPGLPGSSVGDSGWILGAPTTFEGRPALGTPATVTNIPQDWCGEIVPNVYYWRVRARDQQGNVSRWSETGTFGAFAGDPWC